MKAKKKAARLVQRKAPRETKAERLARNKETHEVIARAAQRAGKAGLPGTDEALQAIEEVLSRPTSPAKVEAAVLAPPREVARLEPGIYQNSSRNVAIVYKVGRSLVHFITMMSGTIELERWDTFRFTREFSLALPAYPMRRAARLFMNSYINKTEGAAKALRVLLQRE